VPNSLIFNNELSRDARLLLIWLLAHPEDFQIRPSFCQSTLKFSVKLWGRVTAELIAAGHWERVVSREKNGTFNTENIIYSTPKFDSGQPGGRLPPGGAPPGGDPPGGEAPPITKKDNKEIKNNNNQPSNLKNLEEQKKEVVVDFDDELVKNGLVNLVEKDQIFKILGEVEGQTQRQNLADEMAGALRARGRSGQRGIKNPARFLSTFLSSAELNYAPGEAQLRAARAAAAARSTATFNTKTEYQGGPPPPEIRAQIDKIRHSAGIKKG
jgi:hypothetical protein